MDLKVKTMLSVWFWVGIILITYGIIICGNGIYYVFSPETETALHNLNPNLWWGAIMIVFGLIFVFLDKKNTGGKPE